MLDSRGGPIAARLLGPLLNRRRALPERAERIAIIQPTAIGDTIIGSGCIEAIARRYPSAALTVLHGVNNGPAVKMLRTSVTGVKTGFSNPVTALRSLRAIEPDLVVDLTPWPYLTALCARLAAPVSVGFVPAGSSRGRFFDITVPHRSDRHETGNLAEMAALFDAAPYEMGVVRAAHCLPDRLDGKPLILCHMSAGGSRAIDKAWPEANWIDLAKRLITAGYHIGFTGVPADSLRVDAVIAALGSPSEAVSLTGKLSLAELADLLAVTPLLITVDTGVLHIAAAVGGRSLGLHGPTRAARWGSLASRARGLDSPHPAAGYISYGFETAAEGSQTMAAITVDMVAAEAFAMLAEAEAGQRP